MKTIASLFCCILLSTLAWYSADAATDVKVNLTARVLSVSDPANILNGQVQAGEVFAGSYSYDSTTPPQPMAPNANRYQMVGSMAHVRLALGTTVFETQPGNVWAVANIIANDNNMGADGFELAFANQQPLPNGANVQYVSFRFYNSGGWAPITPALPTTAPNLPDWEERSLIIGGQLNSNYYQLTLEVVSATLVPPQLIEVSPGASRFLPQQRFDASLLLPAGSTVVSAQASVNGVPLPLSYPGACTLAPPNSEGRPAILCPDAHTTLNPNATHIDWSVELASGAILNQSVEWRLLQ